MHNWWLFGTGFLVFTIVGTVILRMLIDNYLPHDTKPSSDMQKKGLKK